MPGIVQNTLKRAAGMLSDDDSRSDTSSSILGSKRTRYDRDASEESSISSVNANGYRNSTSASNDHYEDEFAEEAHQAGSIVRVKLTNFVTYTGAEFHPGPSLNMIIGPNGTGKSTLVCAICLGLGWSPQHLGRAKEIGEFVKHGCAKAEIEIELAAAVNQGDNPIIRRIIQKEGNKSAFFVNGRNTPQKEVLKLARSFSIQIDNLCQFLPQDRVVEFAKLEPVALLRETQRAAAPEQMVIWHDQLKELHAEEKEVERKQQEHGEHLKKLQHKQNATEDDVRRWNERQNFIMKSKALEICRPVVKQRLLREEINGLKTDIRTARAELAQLEADVEPARLAEVDMDAYRVQVDQVVKARRTKVEQAKPSIERMFAKITTEQNIVAEASNEIQAEREAEKQRKRDKTRIDGDIARLQRAKDECPVEYDAATFEAKLAELRNKSSTAERRTVQVTSDMNGLRHRVMELNQNLQSKVNERAQLDTKSGQQANLLARVSRDTARAWDWLQTNLATLPLKGKVYGPPILECTVTDPRYADAVEAALRLGDFTAITCTNKDDAKLINEHLFGKMKLHQISVRTSPQSLASYRPPVTRDELEGYGLDGWLLDYLQGPEPVLAMLCDNAKFHRSGFASRSLSVEQHKALENSPIQRWISGEEICQVARRSEYGASSVAVQPLRKAKFFTDQPVDAEEKRRLDDVIKELKQDNDVLKQSHRELREEYERLKSEQDNAKSEMTAVREEQRKLQKAFAEWQDIPRKMEEKQVELEGILGIMADTSNRIRECFAKSEQASLKVASLTVDYAKAVANLRTLHEGLIEAEIRLIEANCEAEALRDENADIARALDEKKNAVQQLDAHRSAKIAEHRTITAKAQEEINEASEEEKEIIKQHMNLPSLEDLENEIEAVRAHLDMMSEGNPGAIRQYHDRQKQIEQAQQRLEEYEASLAATKEQVNQIRAQWEPELDQLIGKISDGFSHNFQQIGCAGQVSVYKDEDDFERWSIQIQVRFRENESLSILDSHRQSGGERAVSTIFYLMALQDLARSPFRVVDEINQGMDPRNERMVHERMVDIACRERTSQYFLITPKLLNDLKFHPKMKVHCIASGEHMPSRHDTLNFNHLANVALRVKQQRVAA